jgi:type II secretory ATPase GspE/PulE/Tfp pilus assembly ATPase PilB-like protein
MMTLLVDGLHKSLTGLTSLEEIKRVCRDDIVT